MDVLPLQGILLFLTMLGMVTALLLFRGSPRGMAATAVAGLVLAAASPRLFHHFYERLQFKEEYAADDPLVDIVETRSGVVTTDSEATIYGGGARDGILSTDLLESDSTIRPFSLSYFHPAPRRVLLIGVAGGAWSQIIANHPQVESAVAVEINPGYLEVISRYPDVRPLLRNPKLEVVIDDGRRWMSRHRHRKFDAILMDSIQHWRAHATNLLSVEMLALAKSMLEPGGILFYNTTYSVDVQRTSYEVFPHIHRFGPFLAASGTPLQLDEARWRDVLWKYRLDGRPVLDPDSAAARARVEELAKYLRTEDSAGRVHFSVESEGNIRRRTANARVITDDNMASEWRRR
jgi:spermidine synthase